LAKQEPLQNGGPCIPQNVGQQCDIFCLFVGLFITFCDIKKFATSFGPAKAVRRNAETERRDVTYLLISELKLCENLIFLQHTFRKRP